jgi:hypothetical protein
LTRLRGSGKIGLDGVNDQPPVHGEPNKTDAASNRIGRFFFGCCATLAVLGILSVLIACIIGLATGYLFLPGRGGTLELYGTSARIVSALVLLFLASLVYLGTRKRRRDRPKILGDRDYQ